MIRSFESAVVSVVAIELDAPGTSLVLVPSVARLLGKVKATCSMANFSERPQAHHYREHEEHPDYLAHSAPLLVVSHVYVAFALKVTLLPRLEVTMKEYAWPCEGMNVRMVFETSRTVPTSRVPWAVVSGTCFTNAPVVWSTM
jgi:hypothetical protein